MIRVARRVRPGRAISNESEADPSVSLGAASTPWIEGCTAIRRRGRARCACGTWRLCGRCARSCSWRASMLSRWCATGGRCWGRWGSRWWCGGDGGGEGRRGLQCDFGGSGRGGWLTVAPALSLSIYVYNMMYYKWLAPAWPIHLSCTAHTPSLRLSHPSHDRVTISESYPSHPRTPVCH
jgi:hypothetical protein